MPETNDIGRAYGCVFCVTGKESIAARHIERACDNVRVIVGRQLKLKTIHGQSRTEEKALYPGYVFFEAPAHNEIVQRFPKDENILSILKSEEGDWQLYGNDARFVEWLFSYDGLIPFSKAYKEGDWIRIIEGPLLDLQGKIVRFDKRHKSAQVAMTFCNRVIKTWLHFDIVDKMQGSSNDDYIMITNLIENR